MTGIPEWLVKADHSLFFMLNGMASSPALAAAAKALSDLGAYPVILLAGLVLALDGGRPLKRYALAFLMIAPLALAVNAGLKQSIARPRPLAYYQGALSRNEVSILAGERLKKRSFPSGHSTLAFLALGYLAWTKRRHAAWALLLAAAIAWSRVAMGSHFPLDCLAGACLGLFWAWAAWRVCRYLEHASWMNRDKTGGPGPSSGSCSAS